jgi:hypothetical protein
VGSYSMVLHEIKEKASLVSASFRHENRAFNIESHRLAHLVVSKSVACVSRTI